jgi:LPXTG-motif cell wall-anchored protein
VKLGAANAKVVKNLDGTTAPDASAAQLLSITTDDSLGILGDITGQLTDVLDMLSIGELNCEDGALADVICIELGRVNELDQDELTARNMNFGPNTAGIEAAAATVRVLPIAAAALGGDVLGLSLASTTAAANAVDVDRAAPPAPPVVKTSSPLPKTGGDTAMPLTLALLAVGAAGAVLVRRTRTV